MKPVCLITGGASGLGLELVACLSRDYQVVILDLPSPRLSIIGQKFDSLYHPCDVSDYNQVTKVVSHYPQIAVLINCAGVYLDGELTDNDPEKIRQTILVNSLGPINLCRAVVPIMKQQERGTIININSLAGLRPRKLCSVYHASKYALTGFVQSLAPELEPYHIKVTNIYPDIINTNFSKQGTIKRNFSHALDPSQIVKLVDFLLSLDPTTTLPDVTIKHI